MIAIAILNYRTAAATVACMSALLAQVGDSARIYLLDNGSGAINVEVLRRFAEDHPNTLSLTESHENLGFAGGMNLLLRQALADPEITDVLLLNSDTKPVAGFLDAMRARLNPVEHVDMIAARMLHPRGESIESLGIALYRSTLASNRKRENEILLGPTGGCALLTRRLLEDLRANHGEWFDETFFCYAEDIDLVVRARWLGYQAAYAADAVVYHEGSLSSGGPNNDFVLYHGIRNSIWWLAKDAPTSWLLRSLPLFFVLHAGICLRHLRRGRGRVVWRLYRDALRGLPAMLRKRRLIAASRRVSAEQYQYWVDPQFYERDYVRRAWRELWRSP